MTEAEWLACTDPTQMLKFLRGKASDRKLRLFAVACCRRIWHVLLDGRSRAAVDVAEAFADGMALQKQLDAVRHPAWEAIDYFGRERQAGLPVCPNALAASSVADADSWGAAIYTAHDAAWDAKSSRLCQPTRSALAGLLRDICGTTFSPGSISHSTLAWNDGAIPKIAQSIYDDRAFDRLPLLADALEDAGCTDAAILSHCRLPGDHVRGCWVVDLLLGKS